MATPITNNSTNWVWSTGAFSLRPSTPLSNNNTATTSDDTVAASPAPMPPHQAATTMANANSSSVAWPLSRGSSNQRTTVAHPTTATAQPNLNK